MRIVTSLSVTFASLALLAKSAGAQDDGNPHVSLSAENCWPVLPRKDFFIHRLINALDLRLMC